MGRNAKHFIFDRTEMWKSASMDKIGLLILKVEEWKFSWYKFPTALFCFLFFMDLDRFASSRYGQRELTNLSRSIKNKKTKKGSGKFVPRKLPLFYFQDQ